MRDQLLQLVERAGLNPSLGTFAADDRLDLSQCQPILTLEPTHGQDRLDMLLPIVGNRLARPLWLRDQSFAQIDADRLPMNPRPILQFAHLHDGATAWRTGQGKPLCYLYT